MKLKKLLQGTMFVAAAVVCMITGGAVAANAGTLSDAGVSVAVDGTAQTMTVTGGKSDNEIFVGIGKVNAKKVVTVATWDIYDGSEAVVDLSKLSNVKDNYIVVRAGSSDAEPAVVKIPAVNKKAAAAFDAATAELSVGATKADLKAVDENYEYRTAYGSWKAVDDLTKYQQEGATLYVRAKGTTVTSKDIDVTEEKVTYNGGSEFAVYGGAQLPGKEVKVNVAAMAKGPAVAVDYAKGTVSMPKASEYRVLGGKGFSTISEDTQNNTTKPVAVNASALMDLAKDDTAWVEVRTQKDTTKKKAASKWTRVAIEKQKALEIDTVGEAIEADKKAEPGDSYGNGGIKVAVLEEESGKGTVLEVTYNVDAKTGAPKSCVIKNNGAYTYEISIAKADATEVDATAKVYKIAGKKSVTIPKTVADGSVVFIRKAGDKKTTQWVTLYSKLGVIDYPKTVAEEE